MKNSAPLPSSPSQFIHTYTNIDKQNQPHPPSPTNPLINNSTVPTTMTISTPDIKQQTHILNINNTIIQQCYEQCDYPSAISLLDQLHNLIQNAEYEGYQQCYFMQMAVLSYNYACVYHRMDNQEKCREYLAKAIQNYEILFTYAKNRQETIAFNVQYAKMLLQLCAVLSQSGNHKTAIQYAEKSLNKLIECFRLLQAICYEHKLLSCEGDTAQNSIQSEQSRPDKVDFKGVVMREAQSKLKELTSLPTVSVLVDGGLQKKGYYELVMYLWINERKNIIFWKDNWQNNEKNLRKQLDIKSASSPRNILGLQRKPSWSQTFHISSIMALHPKQLPKFPSLHCTPSNCDSFYLLSQSNLSQLALFCSVCYFTIATQTRFNQFDVDIDTIPINECYQRLHGNQTIQKCKLLHVKALEIAVKYLPPSNQFVSHLLGSFNKNYKFLLDQIKQELEASFWEVTESTTPSTSDSNKKIEQQVQQHTQSQDYVNQAQQVRSTNKKLSRKRSKTNDKLQGGRSQSKLKFSK